MDTTTLGDSGLQVSRLCLGTMNFGGPTEETDAWRILDDALEAGINFIDTADVYVGGTTESIVGRWLAHKRDQVVLATKAGNATGDGPNQGGLGRKHLQQALEASLRRLDTDHIDLYYLHRPDPHTPIAETLAFLDQQVRAGTVLYWGMSNYWAWQVADAMGTAAQLNMVGPACIQPVYNLLHRDCEVEELPMAAYYGLGVVPYSPVARGVLTGKYSAGVPDDSRAARSDKRLMETEYRTVNLAVAQQLQPMADHLGCSMTQLAVAWVLANPLITAPIIGPRTLDQFEEYLGALEVELPDWVEERVDSLVAPGTHPDSGWSDPQYPITGRPVGD